MANMRRWLRAVACVAFCLLGSLVGHAETDAETRAAAVLLQRFETVVSIRTNLLPRFFPDDQTEDQIHVDHAADLRLPFLELIGGLKAQAPNMLGDLAKNYRAVLVGAKNFAAPEGLGMVSSDSCYVAVLQGGAQPDLEADFRRPHEESIDGRQVWSWSLPPDEGASKPYTFYAAQIAGSYFVMANNRQDFARVAHDLISAGSSKLQAVSIPGWENLRTYKYWAYRSIRRSGVTNPMASGITGLTADVTALEFFVDVGKKESFLQVFSSDKSMKTEPQIFSKPKLHQLLPQASGIWQATIPLSEDNAGDDALFEVLYRFGFGVYV